LLKKCLSFQAESGKEKEQINPDLHLLLEEIQEQINCKFEITEQENGNIYITKGKAEFYPCIIAHSDDVARYNPNKAIIHFEGAAWIKACDKVTGEPHDTGADDKCGLWAGFQALIDLENVKFAIFYGEENGCNGSKEANMDFFKDCKFVAQFDRNHKNNDFINRTNGKKVCSPEFEEFVKPYLEKYNYKLETGSSTDVGQLRHNGLEISSFNISAGYFKPHSDNSYVIISKLFTSYELVIELFNNFEGQSVFPKEVYVAPSFSSFTPNLFVDKVASYFATKYKKEYKGSNKVEHVIRWIFTEVDKIDDVLMMELPNSVLIIDSLCEYIAAEEEKIEEELLNQKITGLQTRIGFGTCIDKNCKEMRITDFSSETGEIVETCITCNKQFAKKDNFTPPRNDGWNWHDDFSTRNYY